MSDKASTSPPESDIKKISIESGSSTRYEELVQKDRIVVFGNDSCPFCTELERTLNDRAAAGAGKGGAGWSYYRLNRLDNGKALRAKLTEGTGQRSVPYLFVDGQLLGGTDDLKGAEYAGTQPGLLRGGGVAADVDAPTSFPRPLGLFPTTVDNRLVRVVAILRFFVILLAAVLAIVFSVHKTGYLAAGWICVGLFVEFILGTFGGSSACPLGALSAGCVGIGERLIKGCKPKFVTGAPKQFASSVGVLFSGLSALFLLLAPEHGRAFKWIGVFWIVGLMGAVGLNGFVDFCLGCVFFAWGIRFKVFPKSLYAVSISEKPDMKWTWNDTNKRLNEGAATEGSKTFHDRTKESKVDLHWKSKTDDQRRESFGLIKHFNAGYWGMPLSLFALAHVFLYLAVGTYRDYRFDAMRIDVPLAVPRILALLALVCWLVFFVLQVARIAMFPRKVSKEWVDPVRGPAFLFATMCLLILAAMVSSDPEGSKDSWRRFAKALFWVAAPLQLVMSQFCVANWLLYLRDWEHLSPTWLAVPVANVFGAVAYGAVYREFGLEFNKTAGVLWLGFAVLLFFALYPIIVYKISLGHNQDGSRAFHWFIIAAPCVIAVAWHAVESHFSPLFIVLYTGSLALVPVFCYGIFPVRFYFTGKWNMGNWAIAFTCSALALAATTHYFICGPASTFAEVLVYIAVAAASCANVVCFGHFVRDAFTFKVFVAEKELTPLAIMKLTHESIRGLVPKVKEALARAPQSTAAATAFLSLWDDLQLLMHTHMVHEDEVIFPAADDWMPHHSDVFEAEHKEDERQVAEIGPHIVDLAGAVGASGGELSDSRRMAVAALEPLMACHLDFVLRHLRHEEDKFSPLLRKNFAAKTLREVVRKVWAITPPEDRFRFFPLVVKHQRRHPERLAFLKVLLQAMPERARQIGVMLALALDVPTWQRIAEELPDLVPRGMSGYRRYL